MLPDDEYVVVANLSRRVWPDTSLHLLSNGVGKAAEPLQWFVVWVHLRKTVVGFKSGFQWVTPFHLTQSLRLLVNAATVWSSAISAVLWCSTNWSEDQNWRILFFWHEEVHLSINCGDCKEEVYGCLLRSEDLPHLQKTLTWRDIRLLNLGGRKRVQHGDRSTNGEGT